MEIDSKSNTGFLEPGFPAPVNIPEYSRKLSHQPRSFARMSTVSEMSHDGSRESKISNLDSRISLTSRERMAGQWPHHLSRFITNFCELL